MANRVFLVQTPPPTSRGWVPDISAAAQFGRVVTLFQSGDRPGYRPNACLRLLRQKLKDYDSTSDYILWAGGDPVGLFLTGLVLSELQHKTINWLRYERDPLRRDDRSGHRYERMRIELSDALLQSVESSKR